MAAISAWLFVLPAGRGLLPHAAVRLDRPSLLHTGMSKPPPRPSLGQCCRFSFLHPSHGMGPEEGAACPAFLPRDELTALPAPLCSRKAKHLLPLAGERLPTFLEGKFKWLGAAHALKPSTKYDFIVGSAVTPRSLSLPSSWRTPTPALPSR